MTKLKPTTIDEFIEIDRYTEEMGIFPKTEKIKDDYNLIKKLSVLLYSDVVSKNGVRLSYSYFKSFENIFNLSHSMSLDNMVSILDRKTNEPYKKYAKIYHIQKGFLNIIITERLYNAKTKYCVRFMNSNYTKTIKKVFTNNLKSVEDLDLTITEEIKTNTSLYRDIINKDFADNIKINAFTKIKNNLLSAKNTISNLKDKIVSLFNKSK